MPQPSWRPDSLAARLPFLRRRARLAAATRAFFDARGYTEVETPYAVPSPGEEVHLAAFRTERVGTDGERTPLWLHTSPEFAMKRLLVAGAGPIFQLARVWRNGEGSDTHAAEFTMLEWYCPGATLASLMDETEAFLRAVLPPMVRCRGVATRLCGERETPSPLDGEGGGEGSSTHQITRPSHTHPPANPSPRGRGTFERLTMAEAFTRYTGADVLATAGDPDALAAQAGARRRPGENWEDLFFRLLLERVEPRLGRDRPTFLTHWPAAQAALARRDPADPRTALRFELFVCGIELANAFEELTDPAEQRARFMAERARRHAIYGPDWPLDEDFLAALEAGMPPGSGIALGFDRLAMIASGADRIDQVQWLPDATR